MFVLCICIVSIKFDLLQVKCSIIEYQNKHIDKISVNVKGTIIKYLTMKIFYCFNFPEVFKSPVKQFFAVN